MWHTEILSHGRHGHVFDVGRDTAERSTRAVIWITATMMVPDMPDLKKSCRKLGISYWDSLGDRIEQLGRPWS
jgi:hypothetical protein